MRTTEVLGDLTFLLCRCIWILLSSEKNLPRSQDPTEGSWAVCPECPQAEPRPLLLPVTTSSTRACAQEAPPSLLTLSPRSPGGDVHATEVGEVPSVAPTQLVVHVPQHTHTEVFSINTHTGRLYAPL